MAVSTMSTTQAPERRPNANWIDGLAPGETFRYGIHDLRWREDANGNRLMDAGEVERKDKHGQWEALGQKAFDNTVVRRRLCLYLPNAYVYKKTPTRDLELYFDFPEGWKPTDRRPAMLWFFGGSWNVGNPTAFKPQAEYFARRGVVGICADYRIGTVDGADGTMGNDCRAALDGKTAVRWVRMNAAALGVDPERIMAGGDSAGGLVAVATQIPNLNDPQDDAGISADLAALLLQNPYVVRISEESWAFQKSMDFSALPPVWVSYGLADAAAYDDKPGNRREEQNGESFIAELKRAGVPLRTYLKEGMGHGFCSGAQHLDPSTRDIDNFLQECGLLSKPPESKSELTELKAPITRAAVGRLSRALHAGQLEPSVPKQLAFPTALPGQGVSDSDCDRRRRRPRP